MKYLEVLELKKYIYTITTDAKKQADDYIFKLIPTIKANGGLKDVKDELKTSMKACNENIVNAYELCSYEILLHLKTEPEFVTWFSELYLSEFSRILNDSNYDTKKAQHLESLVNQLTN